MPANDIDLEAIARDAMGRYGFLPEFPEPVIHEVGALDAQLLNSQNHGRDLRSLLWSSVDNIDSLDLDQLEYCEPGPHGEILVRVAIADVDLFIPKGCPTDRHAAHNGTSVYTGVLTFPMLPDRLSKGISSLLPARDRSAVVIEYAVLQNGDVRSGAIYRALVNNKAKLVYEEVGAWLEGSGPMPAAVREIPGLAEQLLLQDTAARRMRRRRMEQGALDLETIEAEPRMEDGRVRDLVIQRENAARHLIEEFMIAANGVMVARLGAAGVPMIQRVVRTPRYWERIVQKAAEYGWTLPARADVRALAKFLDHRRDADPERFPDLSLTIVKLLGPGEYMALGPDEDPTGHFSLAVTDYTHATAPNRRYVDVINQRLIKAVLDDAPLPYTAGELAEQAARLTGREKASKKVERFVRKAAAAVLLRDRIGDVFEGLVTGAAEKGTYVRLIAPPVEGRVVRGERGLQVGDRVRVRLLGTDPCNGHIDFACAGRMAD
ncbi:MAG: RNB domain-containing ribonuclease [Methanomicrobiales archaeon]|nr:RNB domain-containing ribonuclease [Methanomicrobiales archaeon]MDI6876260.1 RNB domain-containing ribonuclease [Methanomicrobiales archaeon]